MSDRTDFLIFGAPLIGEEEIAEVVATLRSGWIGTGPRVAQFEREFAAYKGVDPAQVAAVNSCTAALHVAMIAAGLGPGDEVITTPLTFCATVNAIIHAGATPVLADVDPDTMNIDPAAIAERITKRTKAIVPVHFAGRPCEMDEILALAEHHELQVIEDCAHAVEAEYKGHKTGTMGHFGCFSFYVTKNVACGEGGMVIARDPVAAARIRTLALHGMSKDAWKRFGDSGYKHYDVVECGFKYNMMDLQAAIGLHQLRRIEQSWMRRAEIWGRYESAFRDLPLRRPGEAAQDTRHGLHLYAIVVDEAEAGITRDSALDAFTAARIGTGVHYRSLAAHEYYRQRFDWSEMEWPHSAAIGRRTLSLPLSAALTDRDVDDVISAAHTILRPAA